MTSAEAGPLLVLLELGQQARAAASVDELAFLAVNDSRLLLPYRQAALWFVDGGVRAVSGILAPERQGPYAQFLDRLCRALRAGDDLAARRPRIVAATDLAPELAEEWGQWLPLQALWTPLLGDGAPGGLLLAGDEAWDESSLVLFAEWCSIWHHAWCARFRPAPWSLPRLAAAWREGWREFRTGQPGLPWWRRRRERWALGVLVLLCFPVRLTVLAPGELVPAHPAVIRAPLDGIVGQIDVRPNQTLQAGDLLFSFDEAPIAARLEVARQALATAEAEYRQIAQLALTDGKSKGQLAILLGKVAEKRAEAEFLADQFARVRVVAPQAGVALIDDPTEWIGRPVKTGERVMRVADPDDAEIEAWIPIGDAIPLPAKAGASLFLATSPFSAVEGEVRYLGHDAMPRPDGVYAYRLRAALSGTTDQRIGSKGTVKVRGGWVPLAYWVARRPLAILRQYLAI